MMYSTPKDHTESENDEPTDDNANQPLLPTTSAAKISNKTLTTSINITSPDQKRSETKSTNSTASKLNRLDHRRAHREKWGRIHIGILIVSFFSVIYLCFSLNLNVDKRSPQIIVDVPPIDDTLDGPRGNFMSIKSIQFSVHYKLLYFLN